MSTQPYAVTDARGELYHIPDTARVIDLRQRVRAAMERPPVDWDCPERIDEQYLPESLPVRKARAIALKLAAMPPELWDGQLIAGSITLEEPRIHAGDPRFNATAGFPDYLTDAERDEVKARGIRLSCAGHIVPDYPRVLRKGLRGIRSDAEAELSSARDEEEIAFLESTIVAIDGVIHFANCLAEQCETDASAEASETRRSELLQMAENLRLSPADPPALQSVWLLHMIFHSTMNRNAAGRVDQYAWPYLEADLEAGRIDPERAAELVDCFCLKFNERAKAMEDQLSENRSEEQNAAPLRMKSRRSSQVGTLRDRLDATNHWLQNIIIGGITREGTDGTNPLTFLVLRSYKRNEMTQPLITLRLHEQTPDDVLHCACEVLKAGGGMPAFFNDEQLVPALERIGIPTPDARDYTNDGCWEVILPGRTDFRFTRLSVMLCLEWALNQGRSRVCAGTTDDGRHGPDTGDPREFASFDDVWQAFLAQLDPMIGQCVQGVVKGLNSRSEFAPVPLLSALTEGCIPSRCDLTAGGAKFRQFSMLAEGAAHCIDSLTALKTVVFDEKAASMSELCDALDADFEGYDELRARLLAAPKYGNDDERADAIGRALIDAFTSSVAKHAEAHRSLLRFPSGVGTFSWYVGIGQGLGASPDGRLAHEPVSSNFSPAVGRDHDGLPSAILSYSKMHRTNLPAGGPLDLRISKQLVDGEDGTERMAALARSLVEAGGNMMTLTVADTEELLAAQREPEKYQSLRVRMGGWCAYFTMLSREQQDHHIRRQGVQA